MSVEPSRRKCRCCRRMFDPDYRNGYHQRYCSRPACRRASRVATQRQWRRKPENRDHFRGPDEVRRVQEWRREHPGYWKQQSPPNSDLQAVERQQVNREQTSCNAPATAGPPLQEVCWAQNPAFVGLISLVTGSTLQDDIEATTRQVLLRGRNILGLHVPEPMTATVSMYDRQTPDSPGAVAPDPQQL
jgi:hypothetical protein